MSDPPAPRLLRHAGASTAPLANNAAHQFAARHALVHYRSGAVYSFIPKNACSTMRLSLAIANGCIAGPEGHAWIHANNQTFSATLRDLATAPFAFVILRDPFERLASVYLDKIVNRSHDFWQLHALEGHVDDPDAFTFRRFVAGACRHPRANIHWRPQADFLVYDDYDLWLPMEELSEGFAEIERRTGLRSVDARELTKHGNERYALSSDRLHADTSPVEIRQMRREGRSPSLMALYDDALIETVRAAYEADFALRRDRCGRPPSGETGSAALSPAGTSLR